jgi:perosamine synthetase
VTGRLAPGWAADGPCAGAFAGQAAAWLGGTGGVAVSSGTSALHLALLAVGVTPGAEVLIPAYCCAALLNAVRMAEAVPVLVDAAPGAFHLCPQDARRRRTGRTAALVVAHLFGQPAPLAPFLELGLPVIEDCAQSLGAIAEGAPAGGHGAAAVASFYATKVITTGQGGLVASREAECVEKVRDLVEYDQRDEWQPRFSCKMSELQAALGLWQLERLPWFLECRRTLARYYDEALTGCSDLSPPPAMGWSETAGGAGAAAPELADVGSSPHLGLEPICYRYLIRVSNAETAIGALQARDIDARRPVYRPLHHYLGGEYPHAQAAHEQIVSLPLYPTLTSSEAERVVTAVRCLDSEWKLWPLSHHSSPHPF